MLFKFAKIIYFFLVLLNNFISLFAKRFEFLLYLKEFIELNSYKKLIIEDKEIKFFVPNKAVNLRVKRLFTKEPGTLKWIDKFDKKKRIIFWDIGSNIGLFSIYAATKFSNIKVISFEPSTSNLRTLSRNISINNLQEKIIINQFPLTRKQNSYLELKETKFQEGCALNVFGEDFDSEGNKIIQTNSYSIFGNSINNLIDNKILELPDYIKIDVDGIEHLILEGGDKYLKHPKIKSISVEINNNFEIQKKSINDILIKNDFVLKSKNSSNDNPYTLNINTENYIYEKL